MIRHSYVHLLLLILAIFSAASSDLFEICYAFIQKIWHLQIRSYEEDFLDQQIDWMRSVSDGAPVERTFIQFNTNLKARAMKDGEDGEDGEDGDGWILLDVIFAYLIALIVR